ncbi:MULTISPECIES: restriction endonuclease subunit S [unclassified Lysinibacillus]|uniref:restriction endonuclease subunit S n=1 Tax=unclassified Lysinibacillus TaxID=2636778 RepID=UPI001116BF9A|nr:MULTISPECIES: restriction endonuclease subunit S [unclassified Lysinibacillus]
MNEVREGYKMTVLNEIPVDWEVKRIEEVFIISGGMSLSRSQTGEGDVFYLHYGDIHKKSQSIFDLNKDSEWVPLINSKEIKIKENATLESGDVVFADASEDYADIGKNVVVKLREKDKFIAGLHTIFIREKDSKLDLIYKAYCFKTEMVKKQIKVLATGSTVLGISKPNLGKVTFLLPPIKEQKKIAEILSTVDTQIEQTEQLIEKTKKLKKGLMQQLLTKGIGHSELKGSELGEIPIEWGIVELGEISSVIDPQPDHRAPKIDLEDGVPYLGIGNISDGGALDFKNARSVERAALEKQQERFTIEDGDIVFGKIASLGNPKKLTSFIKSRPYAISDKLVLIKSEFKSILYYILKSSYVEKQIDFHKNGSTRLTLGIQDIRKFKIALPSIEEQKKIAEILSTVDAEIDNYEQEKAKYEELKKGLMQQLLTGKIRVKVD